MGLTRAELNDLRTVIRARHGLPEPPPRLAPPPCPARADAPAEAPPAASPPLQRVEDAPRRSGPPPLPPPPEPPWSPDGDVHRLVELVMAMRALSQEAPRSALLPPRPRGLQAA